MAQILVRALGEDVVERLKQRARREGRSLQGEAKIILEQAVAFDPAGALELADRIRQGLRKQRFSDSARVIREERDRR